MEEASSVCCSSNHTPSHTHSSLAHRPNQTSCNLSFGCELGRQRWVTFSFRLDDNPPPLKAGQSNPMADTAREEYTIVTFMEHQLIFPQRARGERERERGKKLATSSTGLLVLYNSFVSILCSHFSFFFLQKNTQSPFPNMHCLVTWFLEKMKKKKKSRSPLSHLTFRKSSCFCCWLRVLGV